MGNTPGRRQVLKGLVASTATGFGLASCSGEQGGTGGPTTSPARSTGSTASGGEVSSPTSSSASLRPNGNPYLAGNFAPVPEEVDSEALRVIGQIPKALEGTYIRNGPNAFDIPRPERHAWFPGAGMLHAISLRDGAASSFSNRFVHGRTLRRIEYPRGRIQRKDPECRRGIFAV